MSQEHQKCLETMKAGAARMGVGVIEVHDTRPAAKDRSPLGIFQPHEFECSAHRISVWVLPTEEQIERWREELSPRN